MQSGPGPARSLITLNERAPAGGGDRTDLLKGRMAMDGARALMRPLDESGVTTLFTNPGTTELHLVGAAEATALAVASAVGRGVPATPVGTAAGGAGERGRSGRGGGVGIGTPGRPPATGATRRDLVGGSRARLMLPALPFAIIAANGVSRVVMGPGWGMLLLLAVGPAVAAAVGGPLYTLAAGAAALAVGLPFAAGMRPAATHRPAEGAFGALAGVTAAGVLASRARPRRDRERAQTRLVAQAAP